MSRITKSDVKQAFEVLGCEYNIPHSRQGAENLGEPCYLALDHYQPGGNPYTWKLCVISVKGGAEWDITEFRLKTNEMYYFLRGLSMSISERFNSFKSIIEKRDAA